MSGRPDTTAAAGRARLLPNAVDPARFQGSHPRPEALSGLRPPVVGYVGEVGPWFDTASVARLARERPSWSVVLVGPVTHPSPGDLLSLPNVHALGPVGYDQVPAFLAHFDCGLVPFVLSPLTHAMDPVKLYEYLAAGLPVVSTPLAEVQRLGDLVIVGEGPALSAAVQRALDQRGPDQVAARQRFAAANTWMGRVETLVRIFEERAPS